MTLLENIPYELRNYRQFCMWKYEKSDGEKPTKVPYCAQTGKHASVNNPQTWCSFDQAAHTLETLPQSYSGIGFVLTENDPFTFIDLDAPKSSDPAEVDSINARQQTVFEEFDSYAEYSPSGKGLHIIVKGAIPSGRKRSSIEIYSSQRFMTLTGNVYRKAPIRDYSDLIKSLWAQMGGEKLEKIKTKSIPQTEEDAEIIKSAKSAANGDKFSDLYDVGNWQKHNYPSQSEADQALINIIAFYSKNHEQIKRIFQSSKLGLRDKAKRNNYINPMIEKAFDRELPKIDFSGLSNQFSALQYNPNTVPLKIDSLGYLLDFAETEPDTEFAIESIMPCGEVILLSADGGVGKTYLGLQLGLNVSAGHSFFGLATKQSPFLFISAEDTKLVIARRMRIIAQHNQLLLKNEFTKPIHDNFNLFEIVGSALWTEQKGSATGVPTSMMGEVEKRIIETGAKVAVIDNAASVFAADHMSNIMVTAFITHLRNIAARTKCTILLLAHVSAEAANNRAPKHYFGSTAWNNAVRSRLFMELIPASNGLAEYIEVHHEKSNYGKLAAPIKLFRDSSTGMLHQLSNRDIAQAIESNITTIAEKVLDDITELHKRGEVVNAAVSGQRTTYAILTQHFPNSYSDTDNKQKREVKLAIQKLSENKRIYKEQCLTDSRNYINQWIPAKVDIVPTLCNESPKQVNLIG